MLLRQDSNQVAVYSINDYQLLRHLHLPGLKKHYKNDMTSCVRHKCLYVSDYDHECIHRYDLSRRITSKWTVGAPPCGLSVTPGGNLLVTCWQPNKLIELSADNGQCVREKTLQPDIECPEFVRYISEKLSYPSRLHLNHTTRRLYVAHDHGIVVVVIQL